MAGEASCNSPAVLSALKAGAAAVAAVAIVVGEVLTAGMAVSDAAPPVAPAPGADEVAGAIRDGKIDN